MTAPTESAASLLEGCLTRIQASKDAGRVPVVVFDLDGTLFDNGPRTWQILVEFAESTNNSALRAKLNDLPRTGLPYLLRDSLARVGYDDEALAEEATEFWFARFFTDDYQAYDEPLSGAIAFVRSIFETGATVAYLTGRDSPGMLVGCAASLRQHGFPVGLAHTALVLKPDFKTPDLEFKADAIAFLDGLGDVVASFDNEPGNCNLFLERWPNALTVFLETSHAPGAPELGAGVHVTTRFDA